MKRRKARTSVTLSDSAMEEARSSARSQGLPVATLLAQRAEQARPLAEADAAAARTVTVTLELPDWMHADWQARADRAGTSLEAMLQTQLNTRRREQAGTRGRTAAQIMLHPDTLDVIRQAAAAQGLSVSRWLHEAHQRLGERGDRAA